MKKFLFGIHCHQPLGNFDRVVCKAIDRCYRPFFNSLKAHPGVRAVVHVSGCLFDFFEQHSPDLMDHLKDLADRKQIDLLGGGYYEPVLPFWPERDQKAQLLKMKAYIRKRFHQDPQGMWLAERVWEPQLPFVIREADYSATFLDDSHFLAAGLVQDQIHGYFRTEDRGRNVAIFPINKTLRYMIPFKPVSALEEFFRSHHEELLTMVDDGEKFGVWPGTAKWVHEDGWLEAFFSFLEREKDLKTVGLEEALDLKDRGLIFLPTTSYEEMEEWTLPPRRQIDLRKVKSSQHDGSAHGAQGLIRGGFFRNFFAKYEESRYLYHRLLSLGEKIRSSDPLYDEYLKVQCNCAYWHGIFGGIYLPHLRHALWKQMIHIDRKLRRKEEKNSLRNRRLQIFVSGDGTIQEFDDLKSCSNLVNTLKRRLEGYHLLAEEKKSSTKGASSIHDEVRSVPEEFAGYLIDDEHPRDLLRDHFLRSVDEDATMARAIVTGKIIPVKRDIQKAKESIAVTLEGEGFILSKKIKLRENTLIAEYLWQKRPEGSDDSLHHVISNDFFILDGYYQPDGTNERKILDEKWKGTCSSLAIKDTVENIDVRVIYSEPLFSWVVPVKTVSLSESGYDCIRQSLAVVVRSPEQSYFEIQIVIGG